MEAPTISRLSLSSLYLEFGFSGQPLSKGTGFLVNTDRGAAIVTNRHNVTGRHQENGNPLSGSGGVPDEVVIFHNSDKKDGAWFGVREPLYNDDSPLWVEHPTGKNEYDFVALPLTNTANVKPYYFDPNEPGPEIHIGPSDIVSVIGFPFGRMYNGLLATWATGFIASEPDFENQPTFLIDCRGRPGQSGSPVVAFRRGGFVDMKDGSSVMFDNSVWRFLGIYSGRINAESDIGIVWKTSKIAELTSSL